MTDEQRMTVARTIAVEQGWTDDPDDVTAETYPDCAFSAGNVEFLVYTDDEADAAAFEYIANTIWAFRSSFLVNYVPEGVTEEVLQLLGEQCENGNPGILAMIGDRLEEVQEDAIQADGRGHFLAGYDFEEIEASDADAYAYRTN